MILANWLAAVGLEAARKLAARARARGGSEEGRTHRTAPHVAERMEPRLLLAVTPAFFQPQQALPAGGGPLALFVTDLNADGQRDVVAANGTGNSVSVWLGNGDGTFASPQTFSTGANSQPHSVLAADVSGDGIPDLIVSDYNTNCVAVLLGNGNGTFTAPVTFSTGAGSHPTSIAGQGLNGDANLDLIVADSGSNDVAVLLGNGNGTFKAAQTFSTGIGSNPVKVVAADVNLDGNIDILTANSGNNSVSMLLGNGNGTFHAQQSFAVGAGRASIRVADVNGDFAADLVVANANDNSVSVLLGNGDGSFQSQVTFSTGADSNPSSAYVGDVNGDGLPDLVVTNFNTASVGVFLGNGDGTFGAPRTFGTDANPTAAVALDVSGDGRPELIVANYGGNSVSVLRADTPPILQSITRLSPAAISDASSVTFTVTFSQPVTGVDPTDFAQVLSVNMVAGTVVVTPASGPAAVYTVTVNGISGNGTLGLNLLHDGTIVNALGSPLDANSTLLPQHSFSTGAGSAPFSVAAAVDLNSDGIPDLAVANFKSDDVGVLLGNGDGTFKPQQTFDTGAGSGPSFVTATSDVNGDGHADLIVANYTTQTVGVLLGNGNGSFQPQQTFAVGAAPEGIAVTDVNNDHKPDIIVTNFGDKTVSVLLSNGNGTFQPQRTFSTGLGGYGVAVADVSGDGIPDIAVAHLNGNDIGVLFGNGDGTFKAPVTFAANFYADAIVAADVNGDGKPDLIASNQRSGFVTVLLSNGNGTFQSPQTYSTGITSDPRAVAVADMNGDGRPDLIVASNFTYTVSVLLGNGDGTFQPPQTFFTGNYSAPSSIAISDLNGDGNPDVAVSDYHSNAVSVLLGVPSQAFTIIRRDADITAANTDVTFNTSAQSAAVSATGSLGEDLGSLLHLSYKNLADNTISAAPIQPGTYEVLAAFDGNNTYNAVPLFDTGKTLVIHPRSVLQSVLLGKLPTTGLVGGQKIKPFHVTVKLANSSASIVSGLVSVNLVLSSSPTGAPGDPIVGTLHKKVKIASSKSAPFGSVLVKTLPRGLLGTVFLVAELTDATGATNVISAGTITIAAPTVDLSALSLTAPARGSRGRKLAAAVTLLQNGNIPVVGTVHVELFLSASRTLGVGAIDLGSFAGRASIQPHKKGTLHLAPTIPSGVTAGFYFVIAKVDPNNALSDTNPANNIIASLKAVAIK